VEVEYGSELCLAIWIFPAIRANFFEPHCLKLDLRRRLEFLQPSSLMVVSLTGNAQYQNIFGSAGTP